jgi:hypothetical protein
MGQRRLTFPLKDFDIQFVEENLMNHVRTLAVLVLFLLGGIARAQEVAVDVAKFAQDLQHIDTNGAQFKMVWWIPTEYWQESFRQVPLTPAQKDAFLKTVDDYTIVAVVDANITPLGGLDARSIGEIRSNISLKIGDGQPLRPLDDKDIADDTRTLLATMKPAFANVLGQFGKGMELVCFKGKDPQAKRLLDPRGSAVFTVTYKNKPYTWRLPIGALLPPKFDAQTGEKFPGNFLFSPYTGKKLADQAPAAPDGRSQK